MYMVFVGLHAYYVPMMTAAYFEKGLLHIITYITEQDPFTVFCDQYYVRHKKIFVMSSVLTGMSVCGCFSPQIKLVYLC